MQLHRTATVATAALLLTLTLLLSPTTTHAHNITAILSKFPDFSTFNHYLTVTHLADDINRRTTITVCAVDNSGMADLLSKHLSIYSIKNVLSLHVLLDYFGAQKLHQITNGTALAATMYQATGSASGSSGFVNITDLRGGRVGFGAKDTGTIDANYVKSLREIPYNISVIQISKMLPNSEAEAPTPGPSQMNLTATMSGHGCRIFAETLSTSDAEKTFEDNVEGGLTIFCPGDDAFKGFLPKYRNLTVAQKQALLEYHGVPIYQSLSMLKSSNGVMNTLATDGANKYDFVVQNDGMDVLLKTKIVTAKITGTLVDEQPVVIFTIDKVLLPKELFKLALTPAPAPAPTPEAESPIPRRRHRSPPAPAPADSPADGPGGDTADQTAADDNNGAVGFSGRWFAGVVGLSIMWLGFLVL